MSGPHSYSITVTVWESPLTDAFRTVRDAAKDIASDLDFKGDCLATITFRDDGDEVVSYSIPYLDREDRI